MSSLLRQDWIEKFRQLNMDFEKKTTKQLYVKWLLPKFVKMWKGYA